MKLTKRRVTVGLISTAVVVAMTGVTTWALAADNTTKTSAGPVRLVVGYKAGADRTVASRAMSAAGARVTTAAGAATSALSAINAARVTVSAEQSSSMISALKSDPNVAYVEKEVRVAAFDVTPNDPSFKYQNEMHVIKAPAAWETTTGSAVTVAVIDTGVTAAYDLAGATVAGYNFVSNNTNAADNEGHGTAVASLIAARGNNGKGMAGVCWTCKIMPVKVLDANGEGTDSDVAQGIIWAVQHGAKILNLSLGGPTSTKVLSDAVAYANMNSALVVAAAGQRRQHHEAVPGRLRRRADGGRDQPLPGLRDRPPTAWPAPRRGRATRPTTSRATPGSTWRLRATCWPWTVVAATTPASRAPRSRPRSWPAPRRW